MTEYLPSDYSIAEEYLFTALQSSEHVLGEHHSVTLLLLKNLTTLYIQMNKYVSFSSFSNFNSFKYRFDDAIALQQLVLNKTIACYILFAGI